MVIQNLSLLRGDDIVYALAVVDENGSVKSLVGAKLWFTVKDNESDADSAAKFQLSSTSSDQIEITDDVGGLADIKITNANTRSLEVQAYVYDVQVKDAASKISTVTKGTFVIVGDVTRATA